MREQLRWALAYIKERYGSIVTARRFHDRHWYDRGGSWPRGEF